MGASSVPPLTPPTGRARTRGNPEKSAETRGNAPIPDSVPPPFRHSPEPRNVDVIEDSTLPAPNLVDFIEDSAIHAHTRPYTRTTDSFPPPAAPSWVLLGSTWGHLGIKLHWNSKNSDFQSVFRGFATNIGAILGPSWYLLGSSRGLLGPTWAILVPSGGLSGPLGAIWGPLGAILGPSCGHRGAILRPLGASWGHLGSSWGDLGANLAPCFGHLGAAWGHPGTSWGHIRGHLWPSWGLFGPPWGNFGPKETPKPYLIASLPPAARQQHHEANSQNHDANSHRTQPLISDFPFPLPQRTRKITIQIRKITKNNVAKSRLRLANS